MTPEEREAQQAMLFLGTWGSTTYPPTRWAPDGEDGPCYGWAETDYAPEWLTESQLDCEPDQCVTVLSCGPHATTGERIPEGYRLAYHYETGEKECPWCGPGTDNEAERASCKLCEGTGLIYWGDEWQVVVFAPRYTYGSGSVGCLYDNGPHCATSREDATEALLETFDDAFETDEAAEAWKAELLENGIAYFPDRAAAGADYAEITDGAT